MTYLFINFFGQKLAQMTCVCVCIYIYIDTHICSRTNTYRGSSKFYNDAYKNYIEVLNTEQGHGLALT
jgi:hypothetical protein